MRHQRRRLASADPEQHVPRHAFGPLCSPQREPYARATSYRKIADLVTAAVLAIGINRIVVTDGRINAAAATPRRAGMLLAFKSDSFPLEK